LSIAALSSWSAGRASPRPPSWVRIPRDATLCVFPCKRFTEVPHHHTAISPDTVARFASIWRGFAPAAHYHSPHCRATMPPSCWLTSSPHLVGLRPDGAFPCFNGATLACLHLNVLLGRLVAGLGGASPRLRLVVAMGGAWWSFAPTPLASVACGGSFNCLPRLHPGCLVGFRPDHARE